MTALPSAEADQLVASIASFDVAVGDDERLIIGLLTGDHRDIGQGSARVRFSYQSDGSAAKPEPPGPWKDARFLMLPEEVTSSPAPVKPTIVESGHGRGVYATQVHFDRAGYYNVEVEADVAGIGMRSTTAALRVRDKHQFLTGGIL